MDIFIKGNEYFADKELMQPIHRVDEELDTETETPYLIAVTGYGNTALLGLYSAFNEQEAVEKMLPQEEWENVAAICPVAVHES